MRTRRLSCLGVTAAVPTVLVGALLHAPLAEAGTTPRCFGQPATIVGSSGQSRVQGTAGPDVIYSRWDDQLLLGRGGDDLLCGQSSIHGGGGDDRMRVRSEEEFLDSSVLRGGPGNDIMHRDETLSDDPHFELETYGGQGRDRLHGGPNLDMLRGGPGRDRILGGGLRDVIAGGRGPDVLVGGRGRDRMAGNAGDDRLKGEVGIDYLRGGPGNDGMRGGPDNDRIWGGSGLDVAHGGAGEDRCEEAEAENCELP